MKKFLVSLVLLVVILFGLSAYFLPSYYFNQLEYDFRYEFQASEQLLAQADEKIALRQASPPNGVSDDDFIMLADQIENDITSAIQHLQSAKQIAFKQSRIPLLPSKYYEYQQLKLDSLDQFITAHSVFLTKKQHDHLLTHLIFQHQVYTTLLVTIEDEDTWKTIMATLDKTLPAFKQDLQTLWDANFISATEYEYLSKQAKMWTYMVEQTLTALETGDRTSFKPDGLDIDGPTNEEFVNGLTEANLQRVALGEHIVEVLDAAYASIGTTSLYYDDQQLADDPLRKLLRQPSPFLPFRGDGTDPAIMPTETEAWRVG